MTPTADPRTTLLDAVCAGDVALLREVLADDVRLRAALPIGVIEEHGSEGVAALFDLWFGAADRIEVRQTTRVAVGDKHRLSWQLRAHYEGPHLTGWFLIEQVVFVDAGDRLHTIELACSGFQPEVPVLAVA